MHVQLVTINYPPEIAGAAHLIHELALSLQARGHEVTVLTNYPRYNLKEVPPQYRRGARMDERWEGIPVRRIRIPSLPRTSRIARGVQHLLFGVWLSLLAIASPRPDVVLVFSPPLPLPWLIGLLGRLRRSGSRGAHGRSSPVRSSPGSGASSPVRPSLTTQFSSPRS